MSLLQRLKLAHDDGPLGAAKVPFHQAAKSQEFAIKAVPAADGGAGGAAAARAAARVGSPEARPVVHLSVTAGPASPQAHGAFLEQLQAFRSANSLHTSPSAPSVGLGVACEEAVDAAPAAAPAFEQPPAMDADCAQEQLAPLRGYRSMMQFHSTQELYRSSQSVVMRATCLATREEVILKQYFKRRLSPRAVHKMQREVELMCLLRGQPGVAQILGHFQDDKLFCIVMELCPGGDLYKRSMLGKEDRPLTQQWICTKVIAPLLRVLSVLHEEYGIVHRDIKPENIFLSADDDLLLGDFGLAIQQQHELPFLKAGTLDYMAPEVIQNALVEDLDEGPRHTAHDLRRRGFQPYNEKVDVWAVGVLAYELMMRGDTPFYHEEPAETEKLILKCDLVEVKFPRQDLLSPWADFVRTTLQLDPARRPSAAQLLRHRWVQLHLQSAHRLPLAPRRSASIAAALERSSSMPSLALAGACERAVGNLPAAASGPAQLERTPAAAAAFVSPAAAGQPAKRPAAASVGAVPALGAAANPGLTATRTALQILAATAAAAAGRPSAPAAAAVSRQAEPAGDAMDVAAEAWGAAAAAAGQAPAAAPSAGSSLAACPGSPQGSESSCCMAADGTADSLICEASGTDADMADAEEAANNMSDADEAADLAAELSAASMSDVELEPLRRFQPCLSLPQPHELAAMQQAAERTLGQPALLSPPSQPLLPAPALPAVCAVAPAGPLPCLAQQGQQGQQCVGRKPSRLGLSSFTAAVLPAGPQAVLSRTAATASQQEAAICAATAAALGAALPAPGQSFGDLPPNLRRMGRTGSVARPMQPLSNRSSAAASPSGQLLAGLPPGLQQSPRSSPAITSAGLPSGLSPCPQQGLSAGSRPGSAGSMEACSQQEPAAAAAALPAGRSPAEPATRRADFAGVLGSSHARSTSSVRLGTSGQRNRLVAYLYRQTVSAVDLVKRRLKPAKRSVSAGGGLSSGSSDSESDSGSGSVRSTLSE